MAELTLQERLQPSLLDRLTDDEPGNLKEAAERRVLTLNQLKASVLRDLAWLFNTTSLFDHGPAARMPAGNSVLNYGLPALAGHRRDGPQRPELRDRGRPLGRTGAAAPAADHQPGPGDRPRARRPGRAEAYMNPRLLEYYNQELQHIRESAAEFAEEFPKIAGRLSLSGFE